tara:strand:- start:886 stop:2007 length:1122 start_codon:yes stop_codon:yes gene_type:complete
MLLSIVIPCLNEEETLGICINKCLKTFKKLQIEGNSEIIIADNGSIDNSINIAQKLGAKVVNVKKKGYGSALITGIESAKGKYIIMGDADNSYDFYELDNFYSKLLNGYDLVQGCRFPSGGGKIEKKAMPFLHKYIGNPFFSFLSKIFFSLPFKDVYCGYRGFDRKKFLELNHVSKGMVFAIENLIKFNVAGYKCSEIPITLYKDGRVKNKSHLNTISDGWKTLKFLLISCPKWLYYIPSIFFLIIAIIMSVDIITDNSVNNLILKLNKINSIFIYFLLSFQIFMFGIFSSLLSIKLRLSKSRFINLFFKIFKIRYAFLISFFIILVSILEKLFFNIIYINPSYFNTIVSFSIFFGFILIANSLFVSLLTIDE